MIKPKKFAKMKKITKMKNIRKTKNIFGYEEDLEAEADDDLDGGMKEEVESNKKTLPNPTSRRLEKKGLSSCPRKMKFKNVGGKFHTSLFQVQPFLLIFHVYKFF